jgi:hypothetical protein
MRRGQSPHLDLVGNNCNNIDLTEAIASDMYHIDPHIVINDFTLRNDYDSEALK